MRFLQILLCFFVANMFWHYGFGQKYNSTIYEITGIVMDEKGESLVGATVSLSDTNTVAYTNVNGYFRLFSSSLNPVTVRITYIGYESHVENIMPVSQHLAIKLFPTSNQLNQVIVSASKSGMEVKRATVSMDVIRSYLIQNKAIVNLEGIMNQMPSVNVVDGQVNIRSGSGWSYGSGSRVLVLVDDMPFLSGDAGQVQWKFLPLENLEQIEVIKGASSVVHGSSALNGVIHIRTAKPQTKPKSSITLITGIYDQPAREEARWTSQNRYQTGVQAYHSQRIYNTDFMASFNFLNDMGYRFGEDDQRFRLNVNTTHRNQKLAGLRYGLNVSYMQQISTSFLLWESFERGYVSQGRNKTITEARLMSVDPHLTYQTSQSTHKVRLRYNGAINIVENTANNNNQSNRFETYLGEYQYVFSLNKNRGTLSTGFTSSYTQSNAVLYGGLNNMLNAAPYAQFDYRYKKIHATAGYRFEYFAMNGQADDASIIRAGLNYELGKATFLRTSFGQGYRFPSIAERYIVTSVGLVNIFPNETLQAERGWTAEAGIKQGFKLSQNWNGYLDIAYFEQHYADMIEFTFGLWRDVNKVPLADAIGFKAINIGSTKISGVDLVVAGEGKLNEDLTLRFLLGYTYTLPVSLEPVRVMAIDSAGNQFNYRSSSSDTASDMLKYRYTHLFKTDVEIEWKKLIAGVSVRYNDYMRNVDAVLLDPTPVLNVLPGVNDARRLNRSGDWIIDIRVGYKITRKFKSQLLINNVTNHEQMTRPGDLRPTRLILLQLQYTF
jgi:outer membrane cobalamin receptor